MASAIYAKQPAAGGIGGLFEQILRRGCLALEVSPTSVIRCAALPLAVVVSGSPTVLVDTVLIAGLLSHAHTKERNVR